MSMPAKYESLYRVKKDDINKAGETLADAFSRDPVWKKVLEDASQEMKNSFFEGAVRYSLRYGEVLATSKRLEGILVWTPDSLADMNMWRWIRSGSIFTGMKHGLKMARLSFKMKPIFDPLVTDRKANMKGRSYLYGMIVGVSHRYQGQGFGKRLIEGLIERSESEKKPVYIETSTESNVKMYERFGFVIVNKTILPVVDLPQWEMIREAG
jgi:ribosomal protein S18 acetylase RimI-like enzyme